MALYQSTRLTFRAIESPQDDQFFHQLLSDPLVWVNASMLLKRPINAAVTTRIRTTAFEPSILGVIISRKEETEEKSDDNSNVTTPIGAMRLHTGDPLEFHNRAAQLGIMIKPEFQGQGYGPESIEWALEWAFISTGLHRVSLSVAQWNERGIKVYEKNGFVLEGRKREALWKDGKWWDILEMAILQREWAEKHGRVIAA